MNGFIDHWRQTYRLHGDVPHGELGALAGAPVLRAYESALDRALGASAEVILVRRVEAQATINLALGTASDWANRCGQMMAAAVLHAIADDAPGNIMRFAHEADHLAAFLQAVAVATDADAWYFARFAPQRRPTVTATLQAVLHKNRDQWQAVWLSLVQRHAASAVLAHLPDELIRELWYEGIAGRVAPVPEEERPLFAAALHVWERLGARVASRQRANQWFEDYLELARAPTDWRDRTHLAEAVFVACRFLLQRCPLAMVPTPEQLTNAVAVLDWLDTAWLVQRLQSVLAPTTAERSSAPRPATSASVSASLRDWLEMCWYVWPKVQAQLDRTHLASPKNALLWWSELLALRPEWADVPGLCSVLETLLQAAATLARTKARTHTATKNDGAAGVHTSAVQTPSASTANHEPMAMQQVQRYGERAMQLVAEMAACAPSTHGISARQQPTTAAGLFLLLRTVQELRLPALAKHLGYPTPGPESATWLLTALGAKLGEFPLADPLDVGLHYFAEHTEPLSWPAFHDAWNNADAHRLQEILVRLLFAHRLWTRDVEPTLVLVHADGKAWLYGGQEASGLWPWVALLPDGSANETLEVWSETWRQHTGRLPQWTWSEQPPSCCTAFPTASVANPLADAVLTLLANIVVRAWARWLKHIGQSSTAYLLRQLLRRSGTLMLDGDTLHVELEPHPLDMLLQLSGYLDPYDVPLGTLFKRVQFRRGDQP